MGVFDVYCEMGIRGSSGQFFSGCCYGRHQQADNRHCVLTSVRGGPLNPNPENSDLSHPSQAPAARKLGKNPAVVVGGPLQQNGAQSGSIVQSNPLSSWVDFPIIFTAMVASLQVFLLVQSVPCCIWGGPTWPLGGDVGTYNTSMEHLPLLEIFLRGECNCRREDTCMSNIAIESQPNLQSFSSFPSPHSYRSP